MNKRKIRSLLIPLLPHVLLLYTSTPFFFAMLERLAKRLFKIEILLSVAMFRVTLIRSEPLHLNFERIFSKLSSFSHRWIFTYSASLLSSKTYEPKFARNSLKIYYNEQKYVFKWDWSSRLTNLVECLIRIWTVDCENKVRLVGKIYRNKHSIKDFPLNKLLGYSGDTVGIVVKSVVDTATRINPIDMNLDRIWLTWCLFCCFFSY